MLRSFCLLATVLCYMVAAKSNSKESAWNGHTIPGSTTPALFTPYWVPDGAKSYDSASPLIHYSGRWIDSFSSTYVHNSIRLSPFPNAAVTFTFTGTGIEWFSSTDPSHGVSKVYIDGKYVQDIDAWSHVSHKQQRIFWNYDLSSGKHTIKIINTGTRPGATSSTFISLDAFVVVKGPDPQDQRQQSFLESFPPHNISSAGDNPRLRTMLAASPDGSWTMEQQGSTGVHAMQLSIISPSHALVVDKVEHNPLTIDGRPAWASLYNLQTHALFPLAVQSNSFCAGGTFLSNGTLINVGGNAVIDGFTSSADFGNLDGMQAIRVFEPCDSDDISQCSLYENHDRLRMASPRWYNTVLRISDGSAMIMGGCKKGGWINNATVNNPSIEYFPPKSIHNSNGMPINLPFLVDTLNSNLFPIAFALPDGKIFVAANTDAMIYDWENNSERRLPNIPNGVRVTYPMAATALLLPLSPENNYEPEVLICGGSTIDDHMADVDISSQTPASSQCSRMVLTDQGIADGWQVEQMPEARIMPDAVLLPTGKIFIVNGAGTGISGYGNVKDQIGASNADHPVLSPILYDPLAPSGSRFTSVGITSSIPRLYHSVATLTPEATVMIAGSNPNLDRSEVKYGTEYRVEWAKPPYITKSRPAIDGSSLPQKLGFGQSIQLKVQGMAGSNIKVVLMDLGFVTHTVHANSRMVYLASSVGNGVITVTGPPSGQVYPPGPGWLYVVVDDVPSVGVKIMVGDGNSPPVDEAALNNLLKNTAINQDEKI